MPDLREVEWLAHIDVPLKEVLELKEALKVAGNGLSHFLVSPIKDCNDLQLIVGIVRIPIVPITK